MTVIFLECPSNWVGDDGGMALSDSAVDAMPVFSSGHGDSGYCSPFLSLRLKA